MGAVLSVLVLLAIAMLVGAFFLWRRGGPRRQIVLMVIAGVVAIINVAIWTLPTASGEAPLAQMQKR